MLDCMESFRARRIVVEPYESMSAEYEQWYVLKRCYIQANMRYTVIQRSVGICKHNFRCRLLLGISRNIEP